MNFGVIVEHRSARRTVTPVQPDPQVNPRQPQPIPTKSPEPKKMLPRIHRLNVYHASYDEYPFYLYITAAAYA